ncbi:hypothetical protein [Candidatus Poriferisocius sp.]|uniref:hypothetical protein n=1 Tax=Candidatus Poriferisocius sp. TaxID=3101276 RepID=UPI003B01876A
MTGIEATRAVYYTRRKATPTGRREIRKWARSVVWLAGFCAYAAWAAHNGLLETDPETWTAAYHQITQNDLGKQAARCAATTAAATWAIVAAPALSWIIRRRPWRPHSGGLHLFSPVWDLPRPRHQPIPPPYFPPLQPDTDTDRDTATAQPAATADPSEPPATAQPAATADPSEPPAPAQPAADHPGGPPQPEHRAETPAQPPATREELLARADGLKARCGKVFNLYCSNRPMRKARESLLAVLVAAGANRAKTDEVAGILRSTQENVRSLMRRAEKDGWVIRESPADWALAPQVKTDIALLVDAVDQNDEQTAEAIAATIGPPLPTVTDEWLDQLIADPTPRKELRLAAAEILTAAAEQWPQNPAWLAATDRLYGDA